MTIYSRAVKREYPFPQADRADRVLDVLAAVCRGPLDDEGLSKEFGIHPRQGRYYADAAGHLGWSACRAGSGARRSLAKKSTA